MASPNKIVILTGWGEKGKPLLSLLKNRGWQIEAVVLPGMHSVKHCLQKKDPPVLGWLLAFRRWIFFRRITRNTRFNLPVDPNLVLISGPLNSKKMESDLRKLSPDFIILNGVGIIKENILSIAKKGVIHAHPGLLPWARGTGVVGRSLEQGIPAGATLHYVNAGIDTGDFIERRILNVTNIEQTLSSIEEAAYHLCNEMIVDFIFNISKSEIALDRIPQPENFPLCKWLSPEEREKLDIKIKNGLALDIFRKWEPLCKSGDKHILNSQFEKPASSI